MGKVARIRVGPSNRKLHLRRWEVGGAKPWERLLAELGEDPRGEIRLWAAVLEQALREVRRPLRPYRVRKGATGVKGSPKRVELPNWWRATPLTEWFASCEAEETGAFGWICRELGLSADEIRGYALR